MIFNCTKNRLILFLPNQHKTAVVGSAFQFYEVEIDAGGQFLAAVFAVPARVVVIAHVELDAETVVHFGREALRTRVVGSPKVVGAVAVGRKDVGNDEFGRKDAVGFAY